MDKILVLDFGGQYNQLIARRVREQQEFYATQGPELHVRREGDKLIADCSPCVMIDFLSNAAWGPDRITRGEDLTHGEYLIKPHDRWVRVEVHDKEGRYAWSNIVKVE